jgi:hypothetical protein
VNKPSLVTQLKKGLSLSLLLLIFFQGGGLQCFFLLRQKLVQVEMAEKLIEKKLPQKSIIITVETYQDKLINGHEIELNGKLYDISSVAFSGNKVQLSVLEDDKEMHILSLLKKVIGSESDHHNQYPQQLLSFMSMLFVVPTFSFINIIHNQTDLQYADLFQYLSLGSSSTPFSPPDCM